MFEHDAPGSLADFEFATLSDDKLFDIYVSKVGGGTVGTPYMGSWHYAITKANSEKVILKGSNLHTGSPATHRKAAEIAADFVDAWDVIDAGGVPREQD